MAEAGFIYTGSKQEPDSVKCFFCDKSLDGWESNDDPWKEHIQHAPDCAFAKLQKSQENITLEEFLILKKEYEIILVKRYFANLKEKVIRKYDELC